MYTLVGEKKSNFLWKVLITTLSFNSYLDIHRKQLYLSRNVLVSKFKTLVSQLTYFFKKFMILKIQLNYTQGYY